MKKYYVFLLATVLSGSLAAQVNTGFTAGLNYSDAAAKTFEGDKVPVTGGIGFHAGLSMRVLFDENIYFLTRAQYTLKRFTVNYNNRDTASIAMNYHYLEIPLLLEFNRHAQGRGFFAQFGPSFSIAMAGNQVIHDESGKNSSQPIKFAFSAYGRFEANLVGNIGYQFTPRMQATIGYTHGLGNIVDDDFGPSIKPRMFSASVHYWLPGRGK
jgi:hypothetical protein